MKARSAQNTPAKDIIEPDEIAPMAVDEGRVRELEEDLRKANVMKADQEVHIMSIQDELRAKSQEAADYLKELSELRASYQDMKYVHEQEQDALGKNHKHTKRL